MTPVPSPETDPYARAAARRVLLVTISLCAALGAAAGQTLWLASQPALPHAWLAVSTVLGAVAGGLLGAAARLLGAFAPRRLQVPRAHSPEVELPAVKTPEAVNVETFCGAPVREITGAYNPLNFVAAADREWSRVRRHGEDAALLLLEVDHFKRLNHAYGRLCGDTMLAEVTRLTCTSLRGHDLPARFGEGVLVVYLPQTELLGALDAAERELDLDRRRALFAEIQRLAADDLPSLPLFFRVDPFVIPKALKGVVPTGTLNSSTLWIEQWRWQQ